VFSTVYSKRYEPTRMRNTSSGPITPRDFPGKGLRPRAWLARMSLTRSGLSIRRDTLSAFGCHETSYRSVKCDAKFSGNILERVSDAVFPVFLKSGGCAFDVA
jgi:hypothetical protein